MPDARLWIRLAISLFVLILIGVSALGWVWTGAHQPVSQSAASRAVLSVGILAGVLTLWALWLARAKGSS
jgi:hypothetical protein